MKIFENFFLRSKILSHTNLQGSSSFIVIDKSVKAILDSGSQIDIEKGLFQIGGSQPKTIEMPSYNCTKIVMDKNSKLIIKGNVQIATGTFIHIKENATLTLLGDNFIGHNNVIICSRNIFIGKNSSTSWNVTLIDHDGHTLYNTSGTKLKVPYRSLIIEDNVGIQMNVTIPRGIHLGSNVLIGPHTILRKDVPENKYIYSKPTTSEKHGISAGLQFFI